MAHIKIVDLPCGWGKSTRILNSYKKHRKYITVLPFLSEVDRFIEKAKDNSGFILTAPKAEDTNKTDHAEMLIRQGKSIACTHALFYRLGTLATQAQDEVTRVEYDSVGIPVIKAKHLLDDYDLIIDETVDPFKMEQAVRTLDFEGDYLGLGIAEVGEDGRVDPTPLWDKKYRDGSKTFDRALYEKAKSGALYRMSEPPRVYRRLQHLSRMEHHEQNNEQVFTRSARTCRTDGFEQRGPA